MEPIVFVNEAGDPTGKTGPKLDSHHEDTELHLAFSCYVFNERGEVLVTQRAMSKKVWPGFWTNSACGHPLPGESLKDALKRRFDYELGMKIKDIKAVLPSYRYIAPAYNGIIENEFCPVFVARAGSQPVPNSDEVAEVKWMSWNDFIAEIDDDSNVYEQFSAENPDDIYHEAPKWSWWCKDQLKQLKSHQAISEYSKPISS